LQDFTAKKHISFRKCAFIFGVKYLKKLYSALDSSVASSASGFSASGSLALSERASTSTSASTSASTSGASFLLASFFLPFLLEAWSLSLPA
jgi:hypothetical protein